MNNQLPFQISTCNQNLFQLNAGSTRFAHEKIRKPHQKIFLDPINPNPTDFFNYVVLKCIKKICFMWYYDFFMCHSIYSVNANKQN